MTILEILQLWAKHTEYEPDQKKFQLGSINHDFHNCGKLMTTLTEEYDSSGMLAVMYAKTIYRQIMEHATMNVMELIKDPHSLDEYLEMWDAFQSPAVSDAEDSLIHSFNHIISSISGAKLIGQSDREEDLKLLYQSIEKVTESLHKCKVELFLSSGRPIGQLDNVSSIIEVFPTLTHCLLTLEKRPDGIYICYISQYGDAGGYFGFFFKSNGNILSINDRIDESYVGQHGHSRNGRWTDGALFDLFPYGEILKFSEHDYKGYATKWEVKKEDSEDESEEEREEKKEFPLKDLKQTSYMSIILAIILLMKKYQGSDLSSVKRKVVDSLLKPNLELLEAGTDCTALAPANESAIVAAANQFSIDFTSEDVISGKPNERFSWKAHSSDADFNSHYDEFGTYSGINQIFVDVYGEGFKLDISRLLYSPDRLQISDRGQVTLKSKEFVGTQEKMMLESYRQSRMQLKEYIERQMLLEYNRCGGHEFVTSWYSSLVKINADRIIQMGVDAWLGVKNGTIYNYERSPFSISCAKKCEVSVEQRISYYTDLLFTINKPYDKIYPYAAEKWLCPITGTAANIWITFYPNTYEEIERLFQVEVPTILKGWSQTGPDGFEMGNSILDSCDPIAEIEHPYDLTNHKAESIYPGIKPTDFHFTVGLSKRGLNKLLKEREQKQNNHPTGGVSGER